MFMNATSNFLLFVNTHTLMFVNSHTLFLLFLIHIIFVLFGKAEILLVSIICICLYAYIMIMTIQVCTFKVHICQKLNISANLHPELSVRDNRWLVERILSKAAQSKFMLTRLFERLGFPLLGELLYKYGVSTPAGLYNTSSLISTLWYISMVTMPMTRCLFMGLRGSCCNNNWRH